MRTLFILASLSLSGAAFADPCGSPGYNGPLTADTRANQPETALIQGTQPVKGIPYFGSQKAHKQAYPH